MTASLLIEAHSRSREQLLAYQRDRLEALLRHAAAESPYYREALGPNPEAGWLEQLPTLSKATLMEQFDGIVTDPALTRPELERHLEERPEGLYRGEYRLFSTSGTTGEPALFVYSRAEFTHWVRVTLRALAEAGVTPAMRVAAIGAPNPLHISRRLIDGIASVRRETAPELYVTTPLDELVATLNEYRPKAIATYSSIAGLLAGEQLDRRLRIRPSVVLVTAEVLTEQAEQRIHDAWKVAPTQLYAATEAPVLACGPRGDGLCICEDEVLLEVVDEENRPLPPGAPGDKVLLTNLINRTQPLIRYELEDSVELAPGSGTPYRRLARIDGRSDDILRFPAREGGREIAVHPYVLHAAFTPFRHVSQYQIVREEHRLRVRIVLRPTAAPDTPDRIRDALETAVEQAGTAAPAIEVERVERIERDRGHAAKAKVIAAVAVVVATAVFAASASARATFVAGGYVGSVSGSHSFVALVLGAHGGVRAYVSNAHQLAERFAGTAGENGLSATSKHGYRLQLQLAHGRAFGTVRRAPHVQCGPCCEAGASLPD